jgi:hypothetical protein
MLLVKPLAIQTCLASGIPSRNVRNMAVRPMRGENGAKADDIT